MSILTAAEIRIERLGALARVFQRADRVLAQQSVVCRIDEDNTFPAPAWSEGSSITFNAAMVGQVATTDDIIKMTGLNYHELSHVLFTPRSDTPLGQSVQIEGLHKAFNILEDQRIETLLTAWYPSTVPYFTMMMMQFILDHQQTRDMNYILCAGRKYLSAEVIEQLRLRYKWQEDLDDIDEIISEYRLLAYPEDSDYGLDLLRDFDEILNRHLDQVDDPYGHNSSGRPEVVNSTGGKPMSGDDQADASAAALEQDEDEDEDEDEGAGDGDESEDESDDKGKGKGKGKAKSDDDEDEDSDDDSAAGGDQADSSDDEGEGGGYSPGKPGSGKKPKAKSNKELEDAMRKAIQDSKTNRNVQEDAQNKQRTMVEDLDSDSFVPQNVDKSHMPLIPVDQDLRRASEEVATVLQQIRADLDPGWETHRNTGRVNISRAMQGIDFEEVFDQWNEGVNDAADFEWVIAVDLSGSMSSQIHDVSMAMWAVKRAIEAVDGSVTVFGFSDDSYLLYDRHEKADGGRAASFHTMGGTTPDVAVREAAKIMHHSKRAHKVFAVFSDGDWGTATKPESYIKKMGEAGVVTVSGFFSSGRIGTTWQQTRDEHLFARSRHHCQIHVRIDKPQDIVQMARDITTSLMH